LRLGEEEGEAWGSSKEVRSRWCSSPASISGDPPAKLRRGGASMVEGRRGLLQDLGREREGEEREGGEEVPRCSALELTCGARG